MESQFLDWWQRDNPIDRDDPKVRKETINRLFRPRFARPVKQFSDLLQQYYGERAGGIQYAEAFELCEYGRQPSRKELRELFPIEVSIRQAESNSR